MKASLLLALLLSGSGAISSAGFAADSAAKSADAKRYPVKGVITAVRTEQSALMVKHEAIPGVMRAMTMLFRVDEPTLKAAKPGQSLTGFLVREADEWWLRDVKLTDAPAEKK